MIRHGSIVRSLTFLAALALGSAALSDGPSKATPTVLKPTAMKRMPCDEVIGDIKAYRSLPDTYTPWGVAFDHYSTTQHPATGRKLLVTNNTDNHHRIYVVPPEGGEPEIWGGEMFGFGSEIHGIVIGGLGAPGLDHDYVWVGETGDQNLIHRVNFTPFLEESFPAPDVSPWSMGGIAWDPRSQSLLVYDHGTNTVHQYDVAVPVPRHMAQVCVQSVVSQGWGITIRECGGDVRVFVSSEDTDNNGRYEFFEFAPSYNIHTNELEGLALIATHHWNDDGFEMVSSPRGLGYNRVTKQLMLVDNSNPGIYTSIDDGCCLLADITGDRQVTFADAQAFMQAMLGPGVQRNPPPQYFEECDFEPEVGDNDVDLADFAIFQREYQP